MSRFTKNKSMIKAAAGGRGNQDEDGGDIDEFIEQQRSLMK